MKPLDGRTIVVTRDRRAGAATIELIRQMGGEPVLIPFIQIKPSVDLTHLDAQLNQVHEFDWLVFSSRNAVDITIGRCRDLGITLEDFQRVQVAAVGTGTADALAAHGIPVALVPARFRWQDLAQDLSRHAGVDSRILFPRGNLAKPQLLEALHRSGFRVTAVTVYETSFSALAAGRLLQLASGGGADVLLLTSDSAAEALAKILNHLGKTSLEFLKPEHGDRRLRRPLIACIGPNTADCARQIGLPVDVTAPEARIESLIDAAANALADRV